MDEQLKAKLKEWAGIYNVRSFIPDDPVQFPHRFTERRALEPILSRNIIKSQIIDNHILSKV